MEEILKEYNSQGYLVLKNFFTKIERETIINNVNFIEHLPAIPGTDYMHYYERHTITGDTLLCRTENFLDRVPSVKELVTGGKLLNVVSAILEQPAFLYKEKINYKPPNPGIMKDGQYVGGGQFLAHQDSGAFVSGNSNFHVTALIAVDPMTANNGCLYIDVARPEIWRNKMALPHSKQGEIAHEIQKTLVWKAIELEPGDVVLFGSYIPHYSPPNNSLSSRKSLYLTYTSSDKRQQYYKEKREAFPPTYERVPGKDYSSGALVYNLANPII